jgi:hypothetical protein
MIKANAKYKPPALLLFFCFVCTSWLPYKPAALVFVLGADKVVALRMFVIPLSAGAGH